VGVSVAIPSLRVGIAAARHAGYRWLLGDDCSLGVGGSTTVAV
jgi:hypothetical protein